jgi:MFS family permease
MSGSDQNEAVLDSPEAGSRARASLFIPNATVFASSFCVMVIELVAGRIIAGYLGSSLYTWTSVIGIVLAGLAIGNYIGGRLADRYELRRMLAILFIVSSVAAISISIFNDFVGEMRALWFLPWPARVASHVALVFFLPSCLLGMISPVVAKMALDLGRETGRTIGNVYAWGVAGSILGTFMTGFYLMELFRTTTIILVVAAVLATIAAFYRFASWKSYSPESTLRA